MASCRVNSSYEDWVCRDGILVPILFRIPASGYSRTTGMGLPLTGIRAMRGSNRWFWRLKTNGTHGCPHLMQIMAKLSLDDYVQTCKTGANNWGGGHDCRQRKE